MIDSINQNGELLTTKAKWPFYGRSFKTVDDWFMALPQDDKYLKYVELNEAVNRIKKLRKVILVISLVMIIGGVILMTTFT